MLTPEQIKFFRDFLVENNILDLYLAAIVDERTRARSPEIKVGVRYASLLASMHIWSNTSYHLAKEPTPITWSSLSGIFEVRVIGSNLSSNLQISANELVELLTKSDNKKRLRLAIRKAYAISGCTK